MHVVCRVEGFVIMRVSSFRIYCPVETALRASLVPGEGFVMSPKGLGTTWNDVLTYVPIRSAWMDWVCAESFLNAEAGPAGRTSSFPKLGKCSSK